MLTRAVTVAALLLTILSTLGLAQPSFAQAGPHPDLPNPAFDFHTFFVTRHGLTTPTFEQYLADAQPEIVQVGYYGPMLHGYGDAPGATGYPMNLPAQGVNNLLNIYRDLNAKVHQNGLKVVGHFQTGKVIGTWADKAHFYDFYTNHWDEQLLGPKPHPDVLEIVQRDAAGQPLEQGRNARTTYVGLCLSSPHTRQMLKQMLQVAIEAGVDGVMTNYNYRWDCVCPYCQRSFKQYLQERYTGAQLRDRLGIDEIATHHFDAIPASIPGYPETAEGQPRSTPASDPLAWEAKRWGALQFKAAFDEIFLDFGRSLKPDLIVATWNHIGNLGHKEERTFLPPELWGRGENYFWYSGGAAFVGDDIDLAEGKVGDAWLLTHYLREMGNGKPFVLGKYDRHRMRLSIAEGVATGGGGMGRYMRYQDPLGYERLVQYTRFVHKHAAFYENAAPVGEIALVLPRQSIQSGYPEAMATFRAVGEALVRDQLLITVVADQKLTADRLARHAITLVADTRCLSDDQWRSLAEHVRSGAPAIFIGQVGSHDTDGRPRDEALSSDLAHLDNVTTLPADATASDIAAALATYEVELTAIEAPWTLRAAAYRQDDRIVLHLVNYKYDQAAFNELGRNPGPAGELPLPQTNVAVDLIIPADQRATAVRLHQPEQDEAKAVAFETQDDRVRFTVPEVLIYGVVEVTLAPK